MIALGIFGLIKGDFAAVWQPVSKGFPAREVLVYLCAFICLLSGIGLLWQRTAVLAARVLLVYLLLWLLLLRVPGIFLSPTVDFWWAACKTAVMLLLEHWKRRASFEGEFLRLLRLFRSRWVVDTRFVENCWTAPFRYGRNSRIQYAA